MSPRTIRRGGHAGAVALLGLGLVAGCGGDGEPQAKDSGAPTPTAQQTLTKAEQASADSLAALFHDGGLETRDADCVASHWVDGAGVERLTAAGILDGQGKAARTNSKPPGEEVVDPYVDGYFACVDFGKYEAVKFENTRPGMVDKAVFARCANKVDEADARQAMRDDLLGEETDVAREVQHQLIQCIGGG